MVHRAGCGIDRVPIVTDLLTRSGYNTCAALSRQTGVPVHVPVRNANRSQPICFGPHLYRARNRIERFFNKIKHCRRIATRYDKLAANYLAFV